MFLLGCRWNYDHGEPAPFTREFAAALCEIPVREAREAIDELKELGAITVVATYGRGVKQPRLWLPAGIETATPNDAAQPQLPPRREAA